MFLSFNTINFKIWLISKINALQAPSPSWLNGFARTSWFIRFLSKFSPSESELSCCMPVIGLTLQFGQIVWRTIHNRMQSVWKQWEQLSSVTTSSIRKSLMQIEQVTSLYFSMWVASIVTSFALSLSDSRVNCWLRLYYLRNCNCSSCSRRNKSWLTLLSRSLTYFLTKMHHLARVNRNQFAGSKERKANTLKRMLMPSIQYMMYM